MRRASATIPSNSPGWNSARWPRNSINIREGIIQMTQSRIDAFTAMLKDQPDNEMIWYGLATEHMKLENWPAAIEALRNVIRIKPDYTSPYQMPGAALAKQARL